MKKIAVGLAIAALPFLAVPAIAQTDSAAQVSPKKELMATYPNLSNQGIFNNPAMFCELGEWAYAAASLNSKPDYAVLSVEKKISPGIWADASYQNGNLSALGSMELSKCLYFGASVSSQSKNGTAGIVYVFNRTHCNFTQAGAQYDLAAQTDRFAVETRQLVLGGWAATLSAQATLHDRQLMDKGAGVQLCNGKNQLSAGFGGKGWEDITLAARRMVNSNGKRFLIDLRATLPRGNLSRAAVKAGVTYVLK